MGARQRTVPILVLLLASALAGGASARRLQQSPSSCGGGGNMVKTQKDFDSVRAAADFYGSIPEALLSANPGLKADSKVPAGTQLCIPYNGGITQGSVSAKKQAINDEITAALSSDAAFEAYFNRWAQTFGKTYPTEEERRRRMAVFRANIAGMRHKNSDASSTYWTQPGPDSDLTDAEYAKKRMGGAAYPSSQGRGR